jgi:mono/diheme cytochrome c family protein
MRSQEGTFMRTLLFALLLLPLALGTANAQTGNAQAGKTLWEGPATQCRNCHGTNGEGAFGPDLAGRGLSVAQFIRAVRQPWGIMPAFIESQISDSEMADFVAYFNTLKPVATPGPWRFEVPQNAPAGQRVGLATVGCLQCHGPTMNGPRQDMGMVGADFSWFTSMVYGHTVAMPKQWQILEEMPAIRVRMGNYSPQRVPEALLREIWTFAQDLGPRAGVAGRVSAGVSGADGVTYTINVENGGLKGKGLTAEDLTVNVVVPAGTKVVRTTGANFQGERQDADLKANVAVWRLNRLAPKEHQTYTLTLSRAATANDNVRGVVRWTKPTVKTGPIDQANIAAAPVTPATQ